MSLDPSNLPEYLSVLKRMSSTSSTPSPFIVGINALIKAFMLKQKYFKVFQFYSLIMEKRSVYLTPDAFTFSMVFNAIYQIRFSKTRNSRSRKHKVPSNVIKARQVYKEMIECHSIRTKGRRTRRSDVVNLRVLNVALRAFMKEDDYAAAFVVVKSYGIFGLRPNVGTYLRVIQPLLKKVKRQVGGISARGEWTERLLEIKRGGGVPWLGKEGKSLTGFPLEMEVVRSLLKLGIKDGVVLDGEDLDAMIADDVSEETEGAEKGDKNEKVDREELASFKDRLMRRMQGLFYYFPHGSDQPPEAQQRKSGSKIRPQDIEKENEAMRAELDPDGSLTAILNGEDLSALKTHRRRSKAKSSQPKPKYGIPTLSMLLASASSIHSKVALHFDGVPLERIVRRAIQANIVSASPIWSSSAAASTSSEDPKPVSLVGSPHKVMLEIIREAKREMIPDTSGSLLVRRRVKCKTDWRDGRRRLLKGDPRAMLAVG
jgi:hypothetical protein